jgi:hypothetical protein
MFVDIVFLQPHGVMHVALFHSVNVYFVKKTDRLTELPVIVTLLQVAINAHIGLNV